MPGDDFDAFFLVVLPRAVGLGRRMGLPLAAAEDVAVDALAKAYARWGRVAPLPWRDAWVLTVTANLARRELRRSSRGAPVTGSLVAAPFEGGVDRRLDLAAALGKLPARQRQVAILRYLADLSEDDVAQALGLKPGSVKSHASRARTALRELLDD